MISVSNLGRSFADRWLFRNVSFQFNEGQRYGIVGANGSGKSTFLRLLSGEETPTEGEVILPRRKRLGVLKQDHFLYEEVPILNVVLMGLPELWKAMQEKEELLSDAGETFDADRFGELEEIIQANDGYSIEAKAGMILEGLGIPAEVHREAMSTLSGGFKLRVLLAQVLAATPDILVLDEPTNHLDILSIRWLESFLKEYSGCVLVVTHDHRFLDEVCTVIVDVDYETMTMYTGNYSHFTVAKVADRERKETEIARKEKEIAHHQAFVDRFRAKNTKARQAQSKIKQIERIEIEPLPPSSRKYPKFRFQQVRPSGREALRIEEVSKAYGDNQVLEDVSLSIARGERVAIIGPNGIGKSTLLKILVDEVAEDQGEVEWGYETYPGYFPQDHKELFKDSNRTVQAWLWDYCAGETIGYVRGQLGLVLFTGDDADKKVTALSGGEGARLLFAKLAVQHPNVLVLDEPTNHLDLEAIEALVDGLKSFEGTLLLVSHDRWFVSKLANRIVEISPRGIRDFPGGYEEFVTHYGDDHLDVEQVELKVKRKRKKADEPEPKSAFRSKQLVKQLRSLEKRRDEAAREIESAEARIEEINQEFCRPGFFEETPAETIRLLKQEQASLESQIEEKMKDWEVLEEELSALQA